MALTKQEMLKRLNEDFDDNQPTKANKPTASTSARILSKEEALKRLNEDFEVTTKSTNTDRNLSASYTNNRNKGKAPKETTYKNPRVEMKNRHREQLSEESKVSNAEEKDDVTAVSTPPSQFTIDASDPLSVSQALEKIELHIKEAEEKVAKLEQEEYSMLPGDLTFALDLEKKTKERQEAIAELRTLEAYRAEYKKLEELNSFTSEITSKEDFEENSVYSPSTHKTAEQLKAEGYKQDAEGEWYKENIFSQKKTYTGEDSDVYTYINDESKRISIDNYHEAIGGIKLYEIKGYHTLTEDEKGAYNYLYHQDRKNGTNTADEYLEKISPWLEKRALDKEAKKYADISKEAPALMSAISFGTNFGNSLMFPAKVLATATGSYDNMQFLDMYGNKTQAIRGAVSEDMGAVGKLLYNSAMSIGDMGVALASGDPILAQVIMSSSAGSSAISNAKNNGASDGKALVLGLGSAAIEWATEKYSVEAILKKPETILGYLATNTATEATEEGASNVGNVALEVVVSWVFGERNEIEQRIDVLIVYEGKTPSEALKIAFNEKAQSLGEDMLVGGITGMGMSTVAASPYIASKGIEKIQNSKTVTQNSHPYDVNKADKGFINAVDSKLLDFIQHVENNPNDNKTKYIIGKVGSKLTNKIKHLLGIDVSSYEHYIKANTIKHIIKGHGKNGTSDHSMADNNDIARIGYVIDNFDEIELLDTPSKEYRDKNQRPAPMIKLSKKVDGTFYVVEAVPDTNAKSLAVVSAYIKKAPSQQTEDVQAPSSNVRNASASNAAFKTEAGKIADVYPDETSKGTPQSGNSDYASSHASDDSIPYHVGNVNSENKASLSDIAELEKQLEERTSNNEPITVEEAKAASGFGERGSGLLAELSNQSGMTYSKAKKAVEAAYFVGFTDSDSSKATFETETQIDAFTAGKMDRLIQDTAAKEISKNASVYDDGVIESEHFKKLSPQAKKMVRTVAKKLGLRAEFVDKLLAAEVDGTEYEANAQHQDGVFSRSATSENPIHEDVIHEALHRMMQIAPEETGILINALIRHAEQYGRANTTGVTLFGAVKTEHDNAGISMNTLGIMEEIAARELQNIFNSPKEFNAWIKSLEANQQAKSGWQKIIEFIQKVIEDAKRFLSQISMTAEEKATANKKIEQLENIKKLLGDAILASENAVNELIQAKNSQNDGEIKPAEDYNVTTSNSLKKKSTAYSEYNTNAMQWAYNSSTKIGDRKVLYNPYTKKYALIEATKDDVGFIELRLGTHNQLRKDLEIYEANKQGEYLDDERAVDTAIYNFELGQRDNARNNVNVGNGRTGIQNVEVSEGKSNSNGTAHFETTDGDYIKKKSADSTLLEINPTADVQDEERSNFNNNISQNGKDVNTTFSLKGGIKSPSKWTTEFLDTVEEAKIKKLFRADDEAYERFGAQVDRWINGNMPSSEQFELGDTPYVLQGVGAKNLPIVMSQGVMVKITGGKHSISLDEIAQLPDAIADPIMVFKSATVGNAFVILTELVDKNGDDVVVALHLNRSEYEHKINRISSVYGKENIEDFVEKQISDGNLKYIEKNKSREWSECRGLYLPKLNTVLDFNNSILEKHDIVNRFGEKNNSENGNLNKKSKSNDTSYSLKGGIKSPSKWTTEFLDTVEDVQNGKKGSVNKLHKYVEDGTISAEKYEELIESYGTIPSGENPHREVSVPRKTEKDKKVSHTVRTILEAKATTDEAVPSIEKLVEDGVFSYDVYTDKKAINDAEAYIQEYGWVEGLKDWFNAVEKGEVSKQITAMGWALYNNAASTAANTSSKTEKDTATRTALDILDAMVRHQRSAAQALQATRILKKLSPETQLYRVQKSVQALQRELRERYADKAPDLEIDEKLAEDFLKAQTQEEREAIEREIYKSIGRQIPSRFIDKWNAWRYLAMLGNLRTHARNFAGNAGFAPVVFVKNLTATGIESIVHRVSGKRTVRSKAILVNRQLLKAAWDDYAIVSDLISNGGKYNDSAMANQYIEEGRKIFNFKPLEWARKANSLLLDTEDMWFSRPHYAYALAQYCKKNNITAEQIKNGKAIAPAREYAIKEAQKATYRDTNAFSQMVSGWGRKGKPGDNIIKKSFNTVVEGILPFRKTPANILARGVEYSPLWLLKGLSYDLVQVSRGKMSAIEVIDNISSGLTGTGLMALGVLLAAQGLIRGHGEDDKDEKEFKELMGHQPYSLELPNGSSITLDWLAPEALPFFVGVNLWETTKGSDEEANLSSILKSVSYISEPMLEMSCLQSLNDLFENIGYASSNDTSGLVSVLASAVTSYIMQIIPTLLGQAERTGEENRMATYTGKNMFLTGDMQYTLGKASAKIPFWDYNQIPYIDAWGRKEASGTALKRGLNNFLNPSYTSTIDTSDMEKELLRLYETTGDNAVFPSRADKYFTVDGKRKDLTAEEYVKYATLKGEKSYKVITDLVKSKAYKNLSDEEKVKAIDEAYTYADQKAKRAVSNYNPDKWVINADEFGSNVGNYLSFRANVSETKEDNDGKISKQGVVDIIMDMAQNDSEAWLMYLSMYENESAAYARANGIQGETYMEFLNSLDKADKPTETGKYGTYTQEEAYEAIKNLTGLSKQDKAILWQSVNKNWQSTNNPFR